MTTKRKRKAPAAKAPKATPKKEFDLLGLGHAIVDAEDILSEASKLTDAIRLMALELNEYEGGAICSVADAIKEKISDGLALIEVYKKGSSLWTRHREAARKVTVSHDDS